MKTEKIFIHPLKREIVFHIGKNKNENFEVIDMGSSNDLWFHAKDESSCHVIGVIPNDICKEDLRYIIKVGALLCKNNTNKLKNLSNIEIIYTEIKNILKTETPGRVLTQNTKKVIL